MLHLEQVAPEGIDHELRRLHFETEDDHTWLSDEDGAREAAEVRLGETLAQLSAVGINVRGEIGDGDPLQALEDALRSFAPDAIVISTHPEGRSHWLEEGIVEEAQRRFDVPVTHVVGDAEAAL